MKAIVKLDGERLDEVALAYGGETSTFTGSYQATRAGVYEFIVYGYDAATGNTGVDRVSFIVTD